MDQADGGGALRRALQRALDQLRHGGRGAAARSTATATTWSRSGSPATAPSCSSTTTRRSSRSTPSTCPRSRDNGTRVRWPEPGGDPHAARRRARTARSTTSATSTWCCRSCTARSARTARSRATSTRSRCRTSAAACSPPRSCMDKHFMKIALQAAGIAVAPWVTVRAPAVGCRTPSACAPRRPSSGCPLFVKPARAGSSVGVSKVDAPDELDAAHGHRVRRGRQGARRDRRGRPRDRGRDARGRRRRPRASLPGEIVLTVARLLRLRGQVPRRRRRRRGLPRRAHRRRSSPRSRTPAIRAFEAIDGRGLARVDMFLTPDGGLVVNELNTMPGFTPISMFPKCWVASGLSYRELDHRADRGGSAPLTRRLVRRPSSTCRSPRSPSGCTIGSMDGSHTIAC